MEKLRAIRKKRNWTQREVANMLGIHCTTYTKYETGDSDPNSEMLSRLADLYEVSTDYLLGRDEKEMPIPSEGDGQAEKLAKALGGIGIDVDTLSDSEINRIARLVKVALEE